MTAPFRLFGAELSPYSVKVRSYLRFKGLAFEWIERSNARQEEFARYAKLPLAPLLVDADETALQDSTPMIEALEREFPQPSITPEESSLAFLSALIEDYADEWLNKAMFHYRWSREADQASAAKRIADMLFEGAPAPEGVEEAVKARMVARLHHVGSSAETAPVIEASFTRLVSMLERLFAQRAYLFGARPSLADFGLAGQLQQLLSDPTPGAVLKAEAPRVVAWLARMENPTAQGEFEPLSSLSGDLAEFLRTEIAGAYLVWMEANARAVEEDGRVRVIIGGAEFSQKPQRYAAKALAELQRKRAALAGDADLSAILGESGCDAVLTGGGSRDMDDSDDTGDDDSADDADDE